MLVLESKNLLWIIHACALCLEYLEESYKGSKESKLLVGEAFLMQQVLQVNFSRDTFITWHVL